MSVDTKKVLSGNYGCMFCLAFGLFSVKCFKDYK